ncbi:MAG: hypothetical protein HQK97_00955 [Nitrospirae bacterium]|nr:hypothetical protein [Nitrospirota bacterium]
MHPDKLDRLREKVFESGNPKLFIPLAQQYNGRGMTADAIHVLEYCIELFPKFMSARAALGNLYMEKGCFIHAIDEFVVIASDIPRNILTHRKLAKLYSAIGQPQNALLSYETILTIDPSDEDALSNIHKIMEVEESAKEHARQEAAAVAVMDAATGFDIEDATTSPLIKHVDEYELPPDIDIDDADDAEGDEGTLEIKKEEPQAGEIPATITADDAEVRDDSAADYTKTEVMPERDYMPDYAQTALPQPINPVDEHDLPLDMDIDGDATAEIKGQEQPQADEIPSEEISADSEVMPERDYMPDYAQTALPQPPLPVDEFELLTDDAQESVEIRQEQPLSGEILSDDITADEEHKSDYIMEETKPAQPVEEHKHLADSDYAEETVELNAQPLSDESIPADTTHERTLEAAPPFDSGEEYKLPPEIDIGGIEYIEGEDQRTMEPLSGEIPLSVKTDEVKPDLSSDVINEEAAPPKMPEPPKPEEQYKPIAGLDDALQTHELNAQPLSDEITTADDIPGADVDTAPDFGIEQTTQPAPFNTVGQCSINDINGGEGLIKLTVEALTDEVIPADTTRERALEAAPPVMFNPAEEYELPPDIDIGDIEDAGGLGQLTVQPLPGEIHLSMRTDEVKPDLMSGQMPEMIIDEAVPPELLIPVNEYELPPVIIEGGDVVAAELTSKPVEDDLSTDEPTAAIDVAQVVEEEPEGMQEATPADTFDFTIEETIRGAEPPDLVEVELDLVPEDLPPLALINPVEELELSPKGIDTIAGAAKTLQHMAEPQIYEPALKAETVSDASPERGLDKESAEIITEKPAPLPTGIKSKPIKDKPLDVEDKPFAQDTKIIKNQISKRVEGKVKPETIDSGRVWLMQELDMIDSYIITEHYLAAIKAFQRLLERYPGDEEILKRLSDIRHLAKHVDKDDNAMIRKLRHIKDKLKERKG